MISAKVDRYSQVHTVCVALLLVAMQLSTIHTLDLQFTQTSSSSVFDSWGIVEVHTHTEKHAHSHTHKNTHITPDEINFLGN